MAGAQNLQDLQSLPHVLVVDDDDRIRKLVSRYLGENGFLSFTAPDAKGAKEIMEIGLFDAIVLDVMMPGQDGRSLAQDIRAGGNDVPIILLTAMGEVEDRITGFQSGADDYLTKPFDPRELVLRLQSLLRRRPQEKAAVKVYTIGRWRYDPQVPELVDGDEAVRLTDVEVNLLKALLREPDTVLSREDLAELCGVDAGERTIDVQVTRLRRKLEEDSKVPRYLLTVRGKGYLLRAEEAGA
ncbi:MAG: DNA-binding response regulator [Micavibrio aeruginosavorus]|uniref:DNA-binding response regulator n=1 Tax=Micavibrio aeruginosavorus TaxID=349221 RepID=A0A2W5A237_9BACT|nr:MAG: DNA-binding response regulator [Micavibrio aeruginosavorus]